MNNFDFEQILNWLEGRLPAEEAREIEEMVSQAGPDTLSLVEWLRRFEHLSKRVDYALLPDTLQDNLKSIFTLSPPAETKPDFFQRFVAALTFDSFRQAAVSGIRAVPASLDRQLIYSTAAADILFDLQGDPPKKHFRVNGQLFPIDESEEMHYVVVLQQDEAPVASKHVDTFGKFLFEAVPPGKYDLILSGSQLEIAIEALELYF